MSTTRQTTLEGEVIGKAPCRSCPLCGTEDIPKSKLPDHIASDECDSALKAA